MLRFRRLLALALLALWLPATMHCDLEAAGLDAFFSCAVEHHGADASAAAAERDACDMVENATFKPAADTATLPPPALCACLLGFAAPVPEPDLTPPAAALSDRIVAPPEVARTWHFVARAAPPARAPSLV